MPKTGISTVLQLRKTFLLFGALLVFGFVSFFPQIILIFYSTHLYRWLSVILRTLTGVLPFSIGDVLYIGVIGWTLYLLYFFLKRAFSGQIPLNQFFASILFALNCVLGAVLIFKILWGLNYARPEINKTLHISDSTYSVPQLTQLAGFFILKLNAIQPNRDTYYSVYKLEKGAKESYHILAGVHPLFTYAAPEVKPTLNSWLVTKMGLEGYYNPFTGEAHINSRLPHFTLPFVTCHEIAHQLGIAREDEANLIGFLACINSPDPNFRYAGYYNILRSILFELRFKSPADFEKIKKLLPMQVLEDLQTEQRFWENNNNEMFGYMDLALDNFLKLNNQPSGIKSYQRIVLWTYNLYKEDMQQVFPNAEVAGMTSTLHNSP